MVTELVSSNSKNTENCLLIHSQWRNMTFGAPTSFLQETLCWRNHLTASITFPPCNNKVDISKCNCFAMVLISTNYWVAGDLVVVLIISWVQVAVSLSCSSSYSRHSPKNSSQNVQSLKSIFIFKPSVSSRSPITATASFVILSSLCLSLETNSMNCKSFFSHHFHHFISHRMCSSCGFMLIH